MTTTPWATPAEAAAYWPNAGQVDQDVLEALLAAATEQCAAYAPALAVDQEVPVRYRLAAIYQARELWAAARRDGDVIASAETAYAVRARDLTSTIRALLRPRRARRSLG